MVGCLVLSSPSDCQCLDRKGSVNGDRSHDGVGFNLYQYRMTSPLLLTWSDQYRMTYDSEGYN